LLGGDRPPPIVALTKRLRDLGKDSAMTTIWRCSWRHATIIRCPNPRIGRRLKKATNLRCPRLQRAALRLASKALIRKPEAFVDFVAGRWETWHSYRGKK
jgi:hypothetical protein